MADQPVSLNSSLGLFCPKSSLIRFGFHSFHIPSLLSLRRNMKYGMEKNGMNTTNKKPDKLEGFRKLALATLIATLLLVGVGSLVRVSGAGLGCPDWPTC